MNKEQAHCESAFLCGNSFGAVLEVASTALEGTPAISQAALRLPVLSLRPLRGRGSAWCVGIYKCCVLVK